MAKYIVKRVLLAIVTVLIVCAITFFSMNAIPGGPFEGEKALSPDVKATLMERYNLTNRWESSLYCILEICCTEISVCH